MVSIPPAAGVAKRPLHLIFLADCSGSMNDEGRIATLNLAMIDLIPSLRELAQSPGGERANIMIGVVEFSTGARWHIPPCSLEQFEWKDLTADGETHMGTAFSLVDEDFRSLPMNKGSLTPIMILVTDGEPTDEWKRPLKKLSENPFGRVAARLAIWIGAQPHCEVLEEFVGSRWSYGTHIFRANAAYQIEGAIEQLWPRAVRELPFDLRPPPEEKDSERSSDLS